MINLQLIAVANLLDCADWQLCTFADGARIYCEHGRIVRDSLSHAACSRLANHAYSQSRKLAAAATHSQ